MQVIKTDIAIETTIPLDFLAGGIIRAMNIQYRAIASAFCKDSGSALFIRPPSSVPKVQPKSGNIAIPIKYLKFRFFLDIEATANISSVMK